MAREWWLRGIIAIGPWYKVLDSVNSEHLAVGQIGA